MMKPEKSEGFGMLVKSLSSKSKGGKMPFKKGKSRKSC